MAELRGVSCSHGWCHHNPPRCLVWAEASRSVGPGGGGVKTLPLCLSFTSLSPSANLLLRSTPTESIIPRANPHFISFLLCRQILIAV